LAVLIKLNSAVFIGKRRVIVSQVKIDVPPASVSVGVFWVEFEGGVVGIKRFIQPALESKVFPTGKQLGVRAASGVTVGDGATGDGMADDAAADSASPGVAVTAAPPDSV
jgi:hypothetical protein